jgi:hypothetical protein
MPNITTEFTVPAEMGLVQRKRDGGMLRMKGMGV